MRVVVVAGGPDKPEDSDGEEQMGTSALNGFMRDEEAVQMRFVDSMHDGTTFGRVEARTKYGKMD